MTKSEAIKALLPLLDVAAHKLSEVRGPIWSSYETGAAIAEFVFECKSAIEQETISLKQKRELWGIFAPTSDWDDVVGDVEIGVQVFKLIETLYQNDILNGGKND